MEHSIILKITILILPIEWNDRPTGEQPLKKKRQCAYETYLNGGVEKVSQNLDLK